MTVEEMLKLIDAGFTAEDIRAMKQKPADDPAPAPAPDPKPDPKQEPDKKPEPTESEKLLSQMSADMAALRKAVYAMNVMNSAQPEQKSVDDILGNMMKGGR